jgi:hypothetical protein
MAFVADQRIPRQDIWRMQYRANRYARHLSQSELDQRIRDVLLNNIHAGQEGIHLGRLNIAPDAVSSPSTVWIEKFTHLLEELNLRHVALDAKLPRDIPNFASDLAKKAAARLASIGVSPEEVFVKFGKRTHMERLYEEGALRIQPATYFAETNHNEARKDDELTHVVSVVMSRDELVKVVSNPQDVPSIIPDQRIDVILKWPSDYWLYCVSSAAEARLFVDYNADSCVIIRDRARFTRMLGIASMKSLSSAAMRHGTAQYADPLLPAASQTFVPLLKHFRYTYQSEYRFCWLPISPIARVAYADVQIGSLKDFSDLIVIG